MDRDEKSDNHDGAFENFLTSAIATLLTIIFSWRLLTESSKKELCYLEKRKGDDLNLHNNSCNVNTGNYVAIKSNITARPASDKNGSKEVLINTSSVKAGSSVAAENQEGIDRPNAENIMLMIVNNGSVTRGRQNQCVYETNNLPKENRANDISTSDNYKNRQISIIGEREFVFIGDNPESIMISDDKSVEAPGIYGNGAMSNGKVGDLKVQQSSGIPESAQKYEDQMATLDLRYDDDCYSDDEDSSSDEEDEEEFDRYVLYGPVLEAIAEENSEDISDSSDGTTIANVSDLEVDFSSDSETSSSSSDEEGRTYYVKGKYKEEDISKFYDSPTHFDVEEELSSSITIGIPFREEFDINLQDNVHDYDNITAENIKFKNHSDSASSLQKWPSGDLLKDDMLPSLDTYREKKDNIDMIDGGSINDKGVKDMPSLTTIQLEPDQYKIKKTEFEQGSDSTKSPTNNISDSQRDIVQNCRQSPAQITLCGKEYALSEQTNYVLSHREVSITDQLHATRLDSNQTDLSLSHTHPSTKRPINSKGDLQDLSGDKGQHNNTSIERHSGNQNLETRDYNKHQGNNSASYVLSMQDKIVYQHKTIIESDISINTVGSNDQRQLGSLCDKSKHADDQANKVQGAANEHSCRYINTTVGIENTALPLTRNNHPDSKQLINNEGNSIIYEGGTNRLQTGGVYTKPHEWIDNNNIHVDTTSMNNSSKINSTTKDIHEDIKHENSLSPHKNNKYEINTQSVSYRSNRQSLDLPNLVTQDCKLESIGNVDYLNSTINLNNESGSPEYHVSDITATQPSLNDCNVTTKFGKIARTGSPLDIVEVNHLDSDTEIEWKGSKGVDKYCDDASTIAQSNLSGKDPKNKIHILTKVNARTDPIKCIGLKSYVYRDCHISRCGEAVPSGSTKNKTVRESKTSTVAKGLSVQNASANIQRKGDICQTIKPANKYTFHLENILPTVSKTQATKDLVTVNVRRSNETAEVKFQQAKPRTLINSHVNHSSPASNVHVGKTDTNMGSGVSTSQNQLADRNRHFLHEDTEGMTSLHQGVYYLVSPDELGDSWWESKHMESKQGSCGVSDSGFEETDTDRTVVKHFPYDRQYYTVIATSTALAEINDSFVRNNVPSGTELSKSTVSAVESAEATGENPYIAVVKATARAATMASASTTSRAKEMHMDFVKDVNVVISTSCNIQGGNTNKNVEEFPKVIEALGNGVKIAVQTVSESQSRHAIRQPQLNESIDYTDISPQKKLTITLEPEIVQGNSTLSGGPRKIEVYLPYYIQDTDLEQTISKSLEQLLCDPAAERTRLHDTVDMATIKVAQAYRNGFPSEDDKSESITFTNSRDSDYSQHQNRCSNSEVGANDNLSTHYSWQVKDRVHPQSPDITYQTWRNTNDESLYMTLQNATLPRRTANTATAGSNSNTNDSLGKTPLQATPENIDTNTQQAVQYESSAVNIGFSSNFVSSEQATRQIKSNAISDNSIQLDCYKETNRPRNAGGLNYRHFSTKDYISDTNVGIDSNKSNMAGLYGSDDEFSYSQILRAASKNSQNYGGNTSGMHNAGPVNNNLAHSANKQSNLQDKPSNVYNNTQQCQPVSVSTAGQPGSLGVSTDSCSGMNPSNRRNEFSIKEVHAPNKSLAMGAQVVNPRLQAQQHDFHSKYIEPPLAQSSFAKATIIEEITESRFSNSAQFDRYQYDNALNKPSVISEHLHMPVRQKKDSADKMDRDKSSAVPKKQYKSVLLTKYEDKKTPLSFLNQIEPPEKDTPESRIRIDNARTGYLHKVPVIRSHKAGVIDKEFEKRQHLRTSGETLNRTNIRESFKIDTDRKQTVSPADVRNSKRGLENVKLQAPSSQHFDKAWTSVPFIMSKSYDHGIDETSSEISSFSMVKSVDNLARTPSVTSLAKQFFSDTRSYSSLLETDLDTGEHREISIVQETDVDSIASCKAKSMSNLCHSIISTFETDSWDKTQSMDILDSSDSPDNSENTSSDKSRESDLPEYIISHQKQSKSEHEIRITNSLNRLNLPDWYKSYKDRKSPDGEHINKFKPIKDGEITSCRPDVSHWDPQRKSGIVHAKPIVIRHRVTPPSRSRSTSDTSSIEDKPFQLPSAKLRETRDRVFKPIKIRSREEIMKTVSNIQFNETKQSAKNFYLKLRGSSSTVSSRSDADSVISSSGASHSSESSNVRNQRANIGYTPLKQSKHGNQTEDSVKKDSEDRSTEIHVIKNNLDVHNGIQSKSPVVSHRIKETTLTFMPSKQSQEELKTFNSIKSKLWDQESPGQGPDYSPSDISDLEVHGNNSVSLPRQGRSDVNNETLVPSSVARLPKSLKSICEPLHSKPKSHEATKSGDNICPTSGTIMEDFPSRKSDKYDNKETGYDKKDVFPVLSYANSHGTRRKNTLDSPSSVRKELHVTLTDTKELKDESVEEGEGDASFEDIIESLLALSDKKSASGASECLESEEHPPSRSLQYLKQIETPQSSLTSVATPRSSNGGVRRPWESSGRSLIEDSRLETSDTQYSSEAEDRLGTEVVIVKCRNTKCSKAAELDEARASYKTCHNCYTYYCSRECRKAHWDRHKKKCLFSRVNSACKHVIKCIHDDSELTHHVSRIARTGYLSTGRGCVMLVFPNPKQAEEFIQNRGSAMDIPASYTSIKELQESNIVDEHMSDLIQMCKKYNPEIKFVIDVAIVVKNIESETMRTFALPRHEGLTVQKCAKLRLSSVIASSRGNKRDDPETLILTAVPGSEYTENMEELKAREVCFINIQRKLRQRGVSLRHQYPDIYTKLCAYVATKENFTPIIIYPFDKKTGKRFMCVIMPQSEPEVEWLQDPDLLDELDLMTDV